ncbi:LysR family transcriptional regulator [Enterovibrio baiacu]|uniref:LysR family transcriptional regulator n=1 Tax=Enterovibrio baiacu TaxID=2491023 RepID=UPI001010E2C4|nr:LysR family transcriptional regulator [Enterovibrio baiacu]MBE1274780.1 LysR family transcriptional regulator [Enterovibrio baiacu]
MKLDDLNLFRLIVENGNYTSASKKTGIPVATLTRRIQALEDDLQIRLLHRDARRLSLTDAGHSFYESCRPLLEQLIATTETLSESCKGASGVLRISAPSNIATKLLHPLFNAFLLAYPDIKLDLSLSNDASPDHCEERHAFFRIGPQRDSSLIARKLQCVRDILVASPQYVANQAPITDATMLDAHQLLKGDPLRRWRLTSSQGQQLSITTQGRIESTELGIVRTAAKDGLGIALMPDVLVNQDITSGKLVQVLSDWTSNPRDIYLMYHDKSNLPEKLRAFIDFALEYFQKNTLKM